MEFRPRRKKSPPVSFRRRFIGSLAVCCCQRQMVSWKFFKNNGNRQFFRRRKGKLYLRSDRFANTNVIYNIEGWLEWIPEFVSHGEKIVTYTTR